MFANHPAIRHLRQIGCALPLMLSACGGGSGMGMDMSMGSTSPTMPSNMMPSGTTGTSMSAPMAATFESIQNNIFTPLCANCHGGANPAANLALDAMHSYADLINVPSTEKPSEVRVKPGDPMDSFLVQHIQNEGDGTTQTDLSYIVQWITDGALPIMSAMMMTTPFQVGAVQPETGDAMQTAPPRVVIGFTQELDASRVNAASVLLERVDDSSGTIPVTTMIPATISIPQGNSRAVLLTPASTLAAGQYQVVLDITAGAEIGSIGGQSLMAPARGVNGERVVTRFSVAAP
jgi:hypothetical protein